jgi:hypothetical protein
MHVCGAELPDTSVGPYVLFSCPLADGHAGPHYAFVNGVRRYWTDSYEKS